MNKARILQNVNVALNHHRITYSSENQEYKVRPVTVLAPASVINARSYYTTSLIDAIETAVEMDKRA